MATRLISKTWRVEDVLTDVTSALLSDPTGTYGVKRNDTGAVVVADGTEMTHSATGIYDYSFTDVAGVAYTAYVEFVYEHTTFRFQVDIPARIETGDMVASYSSLLERVGHFLFGIRSGYSADQTNDILECIRDGLHDVYAAHQWSFFRPRDSITTTAGTAAYSLPAACEAILGDMKYAAGESDYYPPVKQRHISQIYRWLQDDDEQNRPLYFGVETIEFDPIDGSLRQAVFYPTPDAAYVLTTRMQLRPTMIDETNQYPVGGEVLSQLITEACLAAAERNYDEQEKGHTKRFQELLPLCIMTDQELTSPTSLGPDMPETDSTDFRSRAALMGDVSINGTTM